MDKDEKCVRNSRGLCAPELQVKQFVAVVQGRFGSFNVYETGDSKFYLFRPVHNGCEGTIDIPVKKTDLKDDVASALRYGSGGDMRQAK